MKYTGLTCSDNCKHFRIKCTAQKHVLMQYTDLQTETVELVEDDLIFMQMKAWGDLRH